MSKMGKYEAARYEGANWLLSLIDKVGLEEARKEMEYRNIRRFPLHVERSELKRYENELKHMCTKTFACNSLITLRDEFGFGRKRLQQFIDRFNQKADALNEDWATWADYSGVILDETGINIDEEGDFNE